MMIMLRRNDGTRILLIMMMKVQIILFTILSLCSGAAQGRDGYSYFKFSGPVSGAIYKVPINTPHHGQTVDFIAKPDYFYSYGVDDPYTGNAQSHKETRDGQQLYGEYSLVQPDGNIRIVRYTSDPKNGFQATVEYANNEHPTNNNNNDNNKNNKQYN